MPPVPEATQPPLLLVAFEICAWLVGLILLWRLIQGRLGTATPPLAPLALSVEKFFASSLLVVIGGMVFPHLATHLDHGTLGPAAYDGNWWLIVQGAAFQLGMLAGALLSALLFFRRTPSIETPPLPAARSQPILAGLITFLIALPVIGLVGFAWKTLIELLGYSANEQEMVDLFRNADDPTLVAWMIVLAAIVAPVTEELIFRAGLFRYLRTRIPRAFALAIPAILFAILHGNLVALLPLFALGVFFAHAYERTGSIAVPMIAHALFNLHTIVLVMAGVTG